MTPHTPLLRRLVAVIRRAASSQADGLSRRQFLGKSASALAATLLAAGTGNARVPKEPIAILGAGAAGLTAALRLMQAGAQVEIFEGGNRIGGRILTLDRFIAPELNDGKPMFCELGGELVDSNHKDLIDLAKELGVKIQDIKKGDPGVDYYHFEGEIRTDAELIPAFEPLAKQLAKDAHGLQDSDKNYTAKARKFDRMCIHDYLRSFEGKVEPWVLRLLDPQFLLPHNGDPPEVVERRDLARIHAGRVPSLPIEV